MFDKLYSSLGGRVEENKDISLKFTLKTQTKAQYYFEAMTIDDFQSAILATKKLGLPFFVIGGGSNTVSLKEVIPGLIIHNQFIQKSLISENTEYVLLKLSSGYPMGRIVKETTEQGYSGFEYHLGLPGTLGGAIYMNSKWSKPISYCGDNLESAKILNKKGDIREVKRDYFEFDYDYSILQKSGEIFLEGTFKLLKVDPEILKQRAKEALEYRKLTQPFGVATGGCFFQNITTEEKNRLNLKSTSSGYLIENAGLKGTKKGDFIVSEKHANFIINTGTGSPDDLKELLALIKDKVYGKYGVKLKEEVMIV